MGSFWQDVKFGLRVLWKSPGYTLLAAAALALGIGVNTAIFSVADAFLYQAVSFPHLDRMASQGMRFTQHYAGSTVCAPSRSCLMTGLHTGHTPIRGNKEIQPEGQYPLRRDYRRDS